MADTRLSTTRRGMLAASLAIPAAALATTPTVAALATTGDRSAWNGLVATYRAAKAAQSAATPAYNQAEKEFFRRKPKAPKEPEPRTRITDDMTLAEIKALPFAEYTEYERDKAIWQQACDELHREIVDDAEEAWDAAVKRVTVAIAALTAFPALDLAMLREKADMLAAEYGDDFGAGGEARCILADIRNLTREA